MKEMKNFRYSNNLTHVKLDIGLSYSAPQSQIWLEKEKNLLVFGFEPNPESVANIKAGNIQKRHPTHGKPLDKKYIDENRFILIPVALSNVKNEEKMDFYVYEKDCGTASLYKPKDPKLGPIKEIIKVPVFSLKHFFDEFPWDRFPYIDYIKIDAQGSDINILKGTGHYLSERVVYITAESECKQYKKTKHNNTNAIIKFMKRQGFIKVSHKNTSDPTFLNKKFVHLKNIFINQL